jgi:hypothetical protein
VSKARPGAAASAGRSGAAYANTRPLPVR